MDLAPPLSISGGPADAQPRASQTISARLYPGCPGHLGPGHAQPTPAQSHTDVRGHSRLHWQSPWTQGHATLVAVRLQGTTRWASHRSAGRGERWRGDSLAIVKTWSDSAVSHVDGGGAVASSYASCAAGATQARTCSRRALPYPKNSLRSASFLPRASRRCRTVLRTSEKAPANLFMTKRCSAREVALGRGCVRIERSVKWHSCP